MMNDTIPPGPSGQSRAEAGVSSACSTGSLPAMPPGINHAPDPMTASCFARGNRLTFLDRHRPRATDRLVPTSHFLPSIRPVLHGPPRSFLESSASKRHAGSRLTGARYMKVRATWYEIGKNA